VTASASTKTVRPRVLKRFVNSATEPSKTFSSPSSSAPQENDDCIGLAIPVAEDVIAKARAMERITNRLFVADATEGDFASAQHWIEECGRQVRLPRNFCGGLLIVRLYRLVAPRSRQKHNRMAAVHEAAAAYDFAFLALGHADDEADMTLARDGLPTRYVTHPSTRAVDAINLLLSGVAAMQETLERWPLPVAQDLKDSSTGRHPLAMEIMAAFNHALREASFPILLDRAGTGHTSKQVETLSELAPLQIDAESLRRVELFARHRAHTYFLRATELATLLAGYTSIESELLDVLDEIFRLWGALGAAADDVQDMFVDFAAGVHSVCTVMAHMCVAEDVYVRPAFRRALPDDQVRVQRDRLKALFGTPDLEAGRDALVALLDEIELRKALTAHFEDQGTLFAAAVHRAVSRFAFSAELIAEMVSVVCSDPDFALPEVYLIALKEIRDPKVIEIISFEAGKFITEYFLKRFWPEGEESTSTEPSSTVYRA
jgi:hypothetical protein